jgi:hypothetical protein
VEQRFEQQSEPLNQHLHIAATAVATSSIDERTDFRHPHWLIIDVDSVLGLIRRVDVGYIAGVFIIVPVQCPPPVTGEAPIPNLAPTFPVLLKKNAIYA